jgi:hypothetical protein
MYKLYHALYRIDYTLYKLSVYKSRCQTSPLSLLPLGEEEQGSEMFRIQFVLQIFPLSSGEGLGERSTVDIKNELSGIMLVIRHFFFSL